MLVLTLILEWFFDGNTMNCCPEVLLHLTSSVQKPILAEVVLTAL